MIKKIYCLSIPENTYAVLETPIKKYLGLLALPFYLLLTRKWIWKVEKLTDYNLETIDHSYFNKWFSILYQELEGTKRLTPRSAASFSKEKFTDPIDVSVCLQDVLKFFVLLPFLFFASWSFSIRTRLNIIRVTTATLMRYALFRGYFKRYPCRHFITYSDESNHPHRYLAFKQNCPGDFIVIQNGERSYHPQLAYGMMDRYFVFGKAYANILEKIKVRARQFEPVGALCLNQHFDMVMSERASNPEILYDILFMDQGIYPYNGFNRRSGKSLEIIFDHLNRFKRLHPKCRLAYQLRYYESDLERKQATLKVVQEYFHEGIIVLDNDGNGTSYSNILHTNLVVTFESTIGFEALRLQKKVLFVNFSGDPAETLCPDNRFQIDDEHADYDNFERHVEKLLEMDLTEIPQVALERHFTFDGKVQERLAFLINNGGS